MVQTVVAVSWAQSTGTMCAMWPGWPGWPCRRNKQAPQREGDLLVVPRILADQEAG